MRAFRLGLLVLVAGLSLARAAGAAPAATQPAGHALVCADNGHNKVFLVSAEGKITWEYPAAHGQDVWRLPNGNLLFSHVRGVKEVTAAPGAEPKVVWEYKSPAGTEVHSCQPLPDGAVFLAENGTCRLLEIERDGTIRKEVRIRTATQNVHGQFRVARKLTSGHYLVTHNAEKFVREYDGDGQVVRTIATPGNPFVAVRLPNGNTLIACGDGHQLVEVDPKDKVVWSLAENEIPGHPLRFVAGVQRLPNGNTVVCNWGGHGHVGKQPLVFEVTPDKKVVWQLDDHRQFKTISSVHLLDVPGDPTKGQVLR